MTLTGRQCTNQSKISTYFLKISLSSFLSHFPLATLFFFLFPMLFCLRLIRGSYAVHSVATFSVSLYWPTVLHSFLSWHLLQANAELTSHCMIIVYFLAHYSNHIDFSLDVLVTKIDWCLIPKRFLWFLTPLLLQAVKPFIPSFLFSTPSSFFFLSSLVLFFFVLSSFFFFFVANSLSFPLVHYGYR